MAQLVNAIDNWALIKLVGGLAVVISAAVGFFAGALRDYLGNRWKGQQERDLESLRHQFNRTETLLDNLTASGSSAFLSTIERRLDHLQKLWNGMMSIKTHFPTLAYMAYSILTRKEIENLPTTTNVRMRAAIERFDPEKHIDVQFKIFAEIEASRPFIGQHAWNIFFSYQALHGRLVYLLQDGLSKGKAVYWMDDKSFLNQVIGISIPSEDMATLLNSEVMAFTNIRNFLELEIVNEIESQTSGRATIKETVKQAQELSLAMNTLKSGKDSGLAMTEAEHNKSLHLTA